MRKVFAILMSLAYLIVAIGLSNHIGTEIYVLALSLISVMFVWGYTRYISRKYRIALLWVLATTLVFPLVILIAIGLPVYGSWIGSIKALVESFKELGILAGAEMVIPFLITCIWAYISVRINMRLNPDSHSAAG